MRNRIIGILITLGLLAGCFAFFQFTDADVWVQDRLFDFPNQQWVVDRHAPGPRFFFYTGPKVVIIGIGVALLIAVTLPPRWRPAWAKLPWPACRVWCVIACLVAVPSTIGLMKSRSDMYCPWDLDRYGGNQPYHHFFDPLPAGMKSDCGRCFPAGHASGGFALMSLGLLFYGRALCVGWAAGFACGWMMGIYQMLKGAHFLSHTITTMLLAFLIVQVVACCFQIRPQASGAMPRNAGDTAGD